MFTSYLLDDALLAALREMAIDTPTETQRACLPAALEYRDMLVSARTGSGKTLSFLLPVIQRLLDDGEQHHDARHIRALVLVPTRELARQVNKQCLRLTAYCPLTTTTIIGGEDPRHQLTRLQHIPDILIATPGRLLAHLHRQAIDLEAIRVMVLDEADRMLSMGFRETVMEIATYCQGRRQTMLFSASLNHHSFAEMIDTLLDQPETFILNTIREKHDNIHHQMILADDLPHKAALVARLVSRLTAQRDDARCLAFCNTRQQVEALGRLMQQRSVRCATLHGEMDQKQRNDVVRRLRNGDIPLLIATDIAARGIDIPGIDCVINVELARNGEDYAHRAGRTGRADAHGAAIALIDANDWNRMIRIQHFLGIHFEKTRLEGLDAHYQGPKKQKSSGKAAGKAKRNRNKKTGEKTRKPKQRYRDRKNIGKRRKPSGRTTEASDDSTP